MQSVDEFILENQDVLAYSGNNLFGLRDVKELKGVDLVKYLTQNEELLKSISNQNLVLFYSQALKELKKPFEDELCRRCEAKENIIGGSRLERNILFGIHYEVHNRVATTLIKDCNMKVLEDCIVDKIKEAKEKSPEVIEFLKKYPIKGISTYANFFENLENGNIDPSKFEIVDRLLEDNPNAINTINFGICNDDIISMNPNFLKRIAKYPNMSSALLIIHDNNPRMFELLKDKINEWEEHLGEREASNLESSIDYLCSNCINFKDFKQEEFDDMIDFCIIKGQFDYKISYKEDLDKRFESAISGHFPSLDDAKDFYCMKHLGMKYNYCKSTYERKLQILNLDEIENEKIKEYIERIAYIANLDGDEAKQLEELKDKYYSDEFTYRPIYGIHLENWANQIALHSYEEVFEQTEEQIQSSEKKQIEFNGSVINQMDLNENFSIVMRSTDTGFVARKTLEGEGIKAMENIDPSVWMKSCVYCTQDFMGMPPLGDNGVYLGYTKNNANNMGEIGNSDLDSNIRDYGITSHTGKAFKAKDMDSNCRTVYSETTIVGRNPDYIILFNDATDIQKENTYKAALEYGVDVVYIDKDLVEKKQIKRLDEKIGTLRNKFDLDVLQETICQYETNIAGWLLNRDDSEEDQTCTASIDNKKYMKDFEKREQKLYGMIQKYYKYQKSLPDGKDNIERLKTILQGEVDKYADVQPCKKITKVKMKFQAQEMLDVINGKENAKWPETDELAFE